MRGVAVLALLAACGDGGTVPAPPDGPPPDERGVVRVRLRPQTFGFETVIFQNADSTTALVTRMNARGEASALMTSGGFVTIVDVNQRQMFTWTDVQIGDELALGAEPGNSNLSPIRIRIPALEGADQYMLYSGCTEAFEIASAIDEPTVPNIPICRDQQDLLVLATDFDPPDLAQSFIFRAAVNTSAAATLDLRGEAYKPVGMTVTVTGDTPSPVELRQRFATIDGVEQFAPTFQLVDGRAEVPTPMPATGSTIQTVAATSTFQLPPFEDLIAARDVTVAWGPATPVIAIDLSSTLRQLTTYPTFDPTTSAVTWTETAGAAGTALLATLDIQTDIGFFNWSVIAPRTEEAVLRLPVMPQVRMRPLPELTFVSELALIDIEGGYPRVRSALLGAWTPSSGAWWPVDSATGSVRYRSLR